MNQFLIINCKTTNILSNETFRLDDCNVKMPDKKKQNKKNPGIPQGQNWVSQLSLIDVF